MRIQRFGVAWLACALLSVGATANADTRENRYLAGGSVALEAPVPGDLYAAGGSVTVDEAVGGDAVIAGGSISVIAPIGDDVRIAGGSVRIDADVGGELMLAGGQLSIGPKVNIGGGARIAGGNVDVRAIVNGAVRVFAQRATLEGEFKGDVEVAAETIRIAPGTRIGGNLRWASGQAPKIDSSVTIAGTVSEFQHSVRIETPRRQDVRRGLSFAGGFFLLGLLAAGAVLIALVPQFTRSVGRTLRGSPWLSLLLGVALLCAVPPLVVLLLFTVVGIPLALVLLALYPVLLTLGYLMSATTIGDRVMQHFSGDGLAGVGLRIVGLAIGLAVLVLLAFVPWVGFIVVLLALMFGMGALVLEAVRRRSAGAAKA